MSQNSNWYFNQKILHLFFLKVMPVTVESVSEVIEFIIPRQSYLRFVLHRRQMIKQRLNQMWKMNPGYTLIIKNIKPYFFVLIFCAWSNKNSLTHEKAQSLIF